jgi:Flp pilus assembly protein TadB
VDATITYSILFITLLLMVGLFFFIRAATKDRTETLVLSAPEAEEEALQALARYFEGRAYRLQSVTPQVDTVALRGQVRPSVFMAGFLSLLAAIASLCFALVLASLFPSYGLVFTSLVGLSPLAGWLYWQRAGREEQVTLQLSPTAGEVMANLGEKGSTQVSITAHRDELIALQQAWDRGQVV